jgi:hypothetical protein
MSWEEIWISAPDFHLHAARIASEGVRVRALLLVVFSLEVDRGNSCLHFST